MNVFYKCQCAAVLPASFLSHVKPMILCPEEILQKKRQMQILPTIPNLGVSQAVN